MADRVGQQLGNYRLTRILGTGGFAEVYLGEHVYLKTPGAIKLLHTKGTHQKELEGFLREAQAIAQLVHPHIVRVLEFGVHQQETPYLVMDYAANGTLRQRYSSKTPLPLIIPSVKQVAAALQHAHDARIVHRDIKPENMLLGRDDQVLLSDFGLALHAHSSTSLSVQEVAGTAIYMAPEQFQGKPCLASDQYALSVVVYEWLAGECPFHGSFFELATQHLFAPPPPLHEHVPSISPVVEQVVLRALAKAPQDRYASVEEFARELEHATASSHPTSVAGELPLTPARPPTHQKAWQRLPGRTVVEPTTVSPRPPAVDEEPSQILAQPQAHQTVPFLSLSGIKHTDPDWERMLRRLRRSYKELLDQSLHGIAWVELGLSTHPKAVSNVTNLLFRLPQGGERLLAPGTSVLDAYDEAEGELLILGAPGAGKSTLLLDLAQQLVSRALADPTQPLPVILRLSSWALGRSALSDWMIDQLSHTYDVPRQLSERWVKQGRLLPLLDGLDEVEEAACAACIEAINTYHRMYLVPLVVCSRQSEYEAIATQERLALQRAVIVQPLNRTQIEDYLRTAGLSFVGVRTVLHEEQALQELATTPLMLSVLLLTYRGVSPGDIAKPGTGLEQQVWTDYVARQVAEKGNDTRYPLERTQAYLSRLAQQMHVHQQTIFYAEYLHSDWLACDQQRTMMWLTTRLPAMGIGGCVSLLVSLAVGGTFSLMLLLQMGLIGGFVGGSLSQQTSHVTNRLSNGKQAHLRNAILLGVLLATSCGLAPGSTHSLGDWLRIGSILGLGSGLSFLIFQGLLRHRSGTPGRNGRVRPSLQSSLIAWFTTIASPHLWLAAAVLGAGIGLSYRLSLGLSVRLIYGLSVSVTVVLIRAILAGSIGPLRFAERIHWTWHGLLQLEHVRISLIVSGALFLCFGLGFWLDNALSFGLGNALSFGLINGLGGGLGYWGLLGLYQGMKQEHLEDQDRQQFNQGIRRSLRNGLLISLIGTIIISAIGILGGGLANVLRDGLSHGLNVELKYIHSTMLSDACVSLLAGMVVMWALSGGLTVLRHYVIRWLLARRRTFPWHVQAFLDDATMRILLRRVGGGYSFIHRRLQDYFAQSTSDALLAQRETQEQDDGFVPVKETRDKH
ncbi:MAG TPA: protein kinase [Ktedonosporobacter sp.]|nr:protein kinase [Ktedonosporobacter sp.]